LKKEVYTFHFSTTNKIFPVVTYGIWRRLGYKANSDPKPLNCIFRFSSMVDKKRYTREGKPLLRVVAKAKHVSIEEFL
jgi:hypothetical protein